MHKNQENKLSILEQDLKLHCQCDTKVSKEEHSINRIMAFFCSNSIQGDLEKGNLPIVNKLYEVFEWDKFSYFDIMYSFWNMYSYGLHQIDGEYYYITEAENIKHAYKRSKKIHIPSFPKRYLNTNSRDYVKEKQSSKCLEEKYKNIKDLAVKCHSISNFYPVPDNKFNRVKGMCGVGDFLPVMIDKIQKHIDDETSLIQKDICIDLDTLKIWHEFFKEKRQELFLDNEYTVNGDTLKGNLLFRKQSEGRPLPLKETEYIECLNNILDRIHKRAALMEKFWDKKEGSNN
ncbi:hypothetical protein DES38_1175 [Streptohalobacillus salinus]|uniref:Uncharacterized protein n=1 Tax=Streptohalobacillus salinus TaxID=621096 RepID=A0A2V3VYS6_9BACI|nr:hypothetical protein [Streptohalobacillus salinus]PXW87167.1 hypothetical protein DES38_1175 [Streptohalobacillus salinus]